MTHSILISAMLAMFALAACDRPTVVNVPPTQVAVPGPAGPQGATGMQGMQGYDGNQGASGMQGMQGYDGKQGAAGKPGDSTTVIMMPPAPTEPAK